MAKPRDSLSTASSAASDRYGRPPRNVLVRQGSTARSASIYYNEDTTSPYKNSHHLKSQPRKYDRSRKRRLPTKPKSALRQPQKPNGPSQSQQQQQTRRSSIETSSTTNTLPMYKTVRFATRQKHRRTISRYQMSPKEHQNYWLQDNEFDAIQRRNERIIDRIETSYEDNHGNIVVASRQRSSSGKPHTYKCPRGLERGLRTEYRTSQAYKLTALEEVLLEQDLQQREGVYDDVAIARVYAKVARKCLFRAQTRALLDQKAVEKNEFGIEEEDLEDEFGDDCRRLSSEHRCSHAKPLLPGRKNRLKAKLTKMLRSRTDRAASGCLPKP